MKYLGSMPFALLLLAILAAACALGSFLPQGLTQAAYIQQYGDTFGPLITGLGLDDVFHSVWFIVLALLLCLSLLLCSLIRMPQLLARSRREFTSESAIRRYRKLPDNASVCSLPSGTDPAPVFRSLGFSHLETGDFSDADMGTAHVLETTASISASRHYIYSAKNKPGLWGAFICHFGILLLVTGFSLGQTLKEEYTVYGVPGTVKMIGNTALELSIDSFEIALREDDTVKQYTAGLTIRNTDDNSSVSVTSSVNHPASAYGMHFYQNSTGWAATMHVEKEGEEIQSSVIYVGEPVLIEAVDSLYMVLQAFYPDYYPSADGSPSTRSARLNNPAYLYMAWYDNRVIGMNVLYADEKITIDDLTVTFSDPRSYTLIQITKDPATGLAFLGALVILAGLFLSFYVQPAELLAVREGDRWSLAGRSPKGGKLFDDRLAEAVSHAQAPQA